MTNRKKQIGYLIVLSILLMGAFIFYLSLKQEGEFGFLKVVYLDIGQGDAIYIEAPNKKQVLIDTGPSPATLAKLSKVMPFADRSLDLVILTHRDQDHIGGASLLFETYEIDNILMTDQSSETSLSLELDRKIERSNLNKIIAHRGQRFILDADRKIYLDILFPNRNISDFESNETSIVSKLSYGQKSFLFVGDSTIYNESLIIWNEQEQTINSDILLLGHHGSKTSSSLFWLEKVSPDLAIISAGKNNRFGHPAEEILDRLSKSKTPKLITFEEGNITLLSDGQNIFRKK
ncbi:MAG TPA: MBL fold metallo-hydrolase [Candidatus Paceibacterota bacterium]|jgi:competence protein ComEC|nr:MBL fold metallo-hydrolase [Candidatus Paceibacterota bacterium]